MAQSALSPDRITRQREREKERDRGRYRERQRDRLKWGRKNKKGNER